MASVPTVLIVDDDDLVRDAIIGIVQGHGCRVLAASSTVVAMRILAQEHVDVLLTDIVMPERDGIELAREARQLRPNLHIIFLTGYVSQAAVAGALGKLMFKPLRAREIENALEEERTGRG